MFNAADSGIRKEVTKRKTGKKKLPTGTVATLLTLVALHGMHVPLLSANQRSSFFPDPFFLLLVPATAHCTPLSGKVEARATDRS